MEKYLTNKEAMEILRIKTPKSLREKIDQGLKCHGKGKARRFKESEIKEFMEGKT